MAAVPTLPGEAPMMPVGLPASECPGDENAQPMVFFSTPGTDRLYSGGNEEGSVGSFDGVLRRLAFRWEVAVMVVAVWRPILDGDPGEFKILWG